MMQSSEKQIKVLARKLTIREKGESRTLTLQLLTLKPLRPDTYEITDITPYTAEQPATTYISTPLEATTSNDKILIPKAIVLRTK